MFKKNPSLLQTFCHLLILITENSHVFPGQFHVQYDGIQCYILYRTRMVVVKIDLHHSWILLPVAAIFNVGICNRRRSRVREFGVLLVSPCCSHCNSIAAPVTVTRWCRKYDAGEVGGWCSSRDQCIFHWPFSKLRQHLICIVVCFRCLLCYRRSLGIHDAASCSNCQKRNKR